MKSRKIERDLTSGNILLQLVTFIGPLFVSNILQTAYNVVDMAVVGQYVGKSGLSAVSVCGDVLHVITFIAMGFSNAGQVLISQYTGANQPDKAEKLIGNLFTTLMFTAFLFTALTLFFRKGILDFVNAPDEARADALAYLTICSFGLVFTYGYNVVCSVLRGKGDSWHPFVFIAVSSLLNMVLDLVFVIILNLGTAGTAWATVISQAASFVVAIVFLANNKENFGFDFKLQSFALRREAIFPIVKLGIPFALQSGLIHGSKLIVTKWINVYGVDVSAITGVGNKLNSIGVTFSGAVGTSAAAIIGQCIGAKKYDRVKLTVLYSGILALGMGAVMVALLLVLQHQIFGLFTQDASVLAMVESFSPVVIVMICSSAFRAPMNGLINGSGRSELNFLLAILDGLGGHMGLAALLGFALDMGLNGLWYGNAAAGFIPFFVGVIYMISGKWRHASKLIEN